MSKRMDSLEIERAFRRLGELVAYPTDIELLIVGGAAGMLTGVFAGRRTTIDCDVMVYSPSSAWTLVETAAEQVARELQLAREWLNGDVQMRADTLPDGWETRRVWVDQFGVLRVFAASRPDLIAMKVIAGRAQDLEDLKAMRVRAHEVAFVRAHLATLREKGTQAEQIDDAYVVLDALEVHDHD